jgi:hypothetical protein
MAKRRILFIIFRMTWFRFTAARPFPEKPDQSGAAGRELRSWNKVVKENSRVGKCQARSLGSVFFNFDAGEGKGYKQGTVCARKFTAWSGGLSRTKAVVTFNCDERDRQTVTHGHLRVV